MRASQGSLVLKNLHEALVVIVFVSGPVVSVSPRKRGSGTFFGGGM